MEEVPNRLFGKPKAVGLRPGFLPGTVNHWAGISELERNGSIVCLEGCENMYLGFCWLIGFENAEVLDGLRIQTWSPELVELFWSHQGKSLGSSVGEGWLPVEAMRWVVKSLVLMEVVMNSQTLQSS